MFLTCMRPPKLGGYSSTPNLRSTRMAPSRPMIATTPCTRQPHPGTRMAPSCDDAMYRETTARTPNVGRTPWAPTTQPGH